MLLPTLLSKGYTDLTHVDWSESASRSLQRSIGHRAPRIKWVVGDLLKWEPEHPIESVARQGRFHFRSI